MATSSAEYLKAARDATIKYVTLDGEYTRLNLEWLDAVSSKNAETAKSLQAQVESTKAQVEQAQQAAQNAINEASSNVPGADGTTFNAEMEANKQQFETITKVNNKELTNFNKNNTEYERLKEETSKIAPTPPTEPKPTTNTNPTLDKNLAKDDDAKDKNENNATIQNTPNVDSTTSTPTVNPTTEKITSNKPNKRQYNPLSKFSSVTYSISLYAIPVDAYNNYYTQGKWITKDLELLVQSGGITQGVDSPRNKYFDLDLYIDNLEITTLTNSKETSVAGNQSNFKFQIFEPYGMTFPSKLVAAQIDLQKQASIKKVLSSEIDALNTPFLLVVRFYGYDANGNLVTTPIDSGTSNDYTKTDTSAAFERAFPILITQLTFKLENKTTVYDVTCKLLNEQIAYSVTRGVIKTGFSITADTVENALGGTSKSNGNGLLDKLNAQQKNLVNLPQNKKNQEIADEYKIVFQETSGIGEALIVDKDFYVKDYAPSNNVTNASQVNIRTSKLKTTTVNKGNRVIKIAEGTPLLTAIDQIISQSTYLRDAMKAYDSEEIQPTQEQDESTESNKKPRQLSWYSVRPVVKVKGFDNLRKDYAYEITYVIQRYYIPYLRSLIIKGTTNYYGPHKIYNYWYTGENTEVLSWEMQFNLLYYNAMALGSEIAQVSSDNARKSPMPGQGADPTGKLPGTNELQNTVKTFLYSPADQLKAQIKILGDPDFLMPVESGSVEAALTQWYGEDFSINANTGQVFMEIGFNEVDDYDNNTGLMKPKNKIKFWDYPADIQRQSQGRMIYMITKVTSKFNRGVFTQDLKTILPNFSEEKSTTETTRATEEPPANPPERQPVTVSNNKNKGPDLSNNYVPRRSNYNENYSNEGRNNPKPVTKPIATSSNDDFSDPMGTTDPFAITKATDSAREGSIGKFLGSIFGAGQNAGKGRGAVRK